MVEVVFVLSVAGVFVPWIVLGRVIEMESGSGYVGFAAVLMVGAVVGLLSIWGLTG